MNVLAPIVFERDGRIYANSRDVATFFGKRHADVLRSIKGLDCSPEFSERNFALAEYTDDQGKPRVAFDATKDGFAFLVMGFTGKDAARFKEAYIARFNAMEAALQPAPGSELARRTDGIARSTIHKVTELQGDVASIGTAVIELARQVRLRITRDIGEARRMADFVLGTSDAETVDAAFGGPRE